MGLADVCRRLAVGFVSICMGSNEMSKNLSRRAFLKGAITLVVSVPLASLLPKIGVKESDKLAGNNMALASPDFVSFDENGLAINWSNNDRVLEAQTVKAIEYTGERIVTVDGLDFIPDVVFVHGVMR
jgi:hypothetical protein